METLFGDDKMTFGKYYGIEVKLLIQSNPKYLLWLDGKRVILSNFVRRECEIRAYPRVWTGKRWINRLPIEQTTMIIVNKNVKLRVGGRKAPAISVDEFVQILVDKLGVNPEVDEVFDIIDNMEDCGKFWKDINKIEVNFENYGPAEEFYGYSDSDFDYRANYLHESLPILMTKSGVPYLCCSGGGDWEVPVVFMIYWDGKGFRGYIPTKGNPWNTKTKAAFNNDTEADNKFIHAQGYPNFDMEDGPEGVVADIDMCIEDFESRIEIC